jgi:hypothetical protein
MSVASLQANWVEQCIKGYNSGISDFRKSINHKNDA